MERTSYKLPNGSYNMEGTSWNLHHYKLPHGTYIMEVT